MTRKEYCALSAREQKIRGEIQKAGGITHDIHARHFSKMGPVELREELRRLGFTGHERLSLKSVEALIIVNNGKGTPKFLIPQRPQGVDYKAKPVYGLAGGTCKDANETPAEAAVRLMSAKYGIPIRAEDLVEQGIHVHEHVYEGNGDKCEFTAHRYIIFYDKMPNMNCDPRYTAEMGIFTSLGEIVAENFLPTQIDFIVEQMALYAV